MPKSTYLQRSELAFNAQLQTFKNNIGPYATPLGLIVGQTTAQAADAAYFNYVLQCLDIMQNAAQQWTGWKDYLRKGGAASGTVSPMPVNLPISVAAVALDIEARFRALVKIVKASPNYNPTVGEVLGIEGPEQTGPDLTTVQPVIAATITGGHVSIKWGFQGQRAFLDSCEIQVDRGDGHGFGLLTIDTTPNYNDTQTFPATLMKWLYRAIYRVGDAQVGLWSSPVSVNVPA